MKKQIFLISLLAFSMLACITTGDEGVEPTPEVAPEGVERFHPENIEKWGCPEPNKVPPFIEIPECEEQNEVSEN